MGKSKKFKKPLKNSCLTANILNDEVKVSDTLITWYVKDYSQLHLYVHYYNFLEKNHTIWRLFIKRAPLSLYVFLTTPAYVKDMNISIRGSNGEIMEKRSAINKDNSHCTVFDEQKILPPCGKLIDDILTVQFLFNSKPHEKTIHLDPGLKQCSEMTSDVNILFNDLKHLYLSAEFYDFILEVGHVKFKVHKLILFRHSKYLARKKTEDREWTGNHFDISANPVMMHEVLLYIYSGELTNLDTEGMRDVYFIAACLEISSLLDICIHFFRSLFTVNNVGSFLGTSLYHNNRDLQREVILFMKKQPETVRETRAWAGANQAVMRYLPEDLRKLYES